MEACSCPSSISQHVLHHGEAGGAEPRAPLLWVWDSPGAEAEAAARRNFSSIWWAPHAQLAWIASALTNQAAIRVISDDPAENTVKLEPVWGQNRAAPPGQARTSPGMLPAGLHCPRSPSGFPRAPLSSFT